MQRRKLTDQLNEIVLISNMPKRVISLVPSQTELLFDLGLGEYVIGVTKFCIHPKEAKSTKAIIGGTKNFRINEIDALKPDLIIGNKEENYAEGINQLKEKYPVWMSDIYTLEDVYDMISALGTMFNIEPKAKKLTDSISESFDSIQHVSKTAVYLIWNDPIMAAGKNTFINEMLNKAGIKNVVTSKRYPEISESELKQLNPEVLLLSSEPFPFKEKHVSYFQQILPDAKVIVVDGELFSWYGSRLLKSSDYFNSLHALINQ